MLETIEIVDHSITKGEQLHHVVVNAGKIVSMQKNLKLKRSVNESDLINADGQAVVWASKILGNPLKERVAGIDLMINLVALAHKKQYKIFFFGAKEEVVKSVVDKYTDQYSSNIIAGYRNGYQNKKLPKKVNFIMGVGGSFDVVAGHVKRAPLWMQNIGLEWFYRFAQEPRRMWKRYLIGNIKFITLVIKSKLFK